MKAETRVDLSNPCPHVTPEMPRSVSSADAGCSARIAWQDRRTGLAHLRVWPHPAATSAAASSSCRTGTRRRTSSTPTIRSSPRARSARRGLIATPTTSSSRRSEATPKNASERTRPTWLAKHGEAVCSEASKRPALLEKPGVEAEVDPLHAGAPADRAGGVGAQDVEAGVDADEDDADLEVERAAAVEGEARGVAEAAAQVSIDRRLDEAAEAEVGAGDPAEGRDRSWRPARCCRRCGRRP